jgi:DNA-binding NarL/FixJ family response regulator
MNKVVRILVANRPKLMRELILATLADEPGVEIVGEVADDADIPEYVHRTHPDLLVIALDEPGSRPQVCDTVLRDHPEVRIIAVAANQNRSIGYWMSMDIHSDDIETSEAGILNAVRSLATGVGGGS